MRYLIFLVFLCGCKVQEQPFDMKTVQEPFDINVLKR